MSFDFCEVREVDLDWVEDRIASGALPGVVISSMGYKRRDGEAVRIVRTPRAITDRLLMHANGSALLVPKPRPRPAR
ncbi:MAG TPA: hypothetical protein VEA79_00205 [Phenylobacterium sp.]|nr:hypothetical protein [Phenylobacterium sp.]